MNTQYTRTAIGLHWLMAALILTALAVGWIMTGLPISPTRLRVFNYHKWIGVTVLLLLVLRTGWRLTHRPPPDLPMPLFQRIASHSVHVLLYVCMLLQPLTGWIYSNAAGYPIVYLKLIPLPNIVGKNHELAGQFRAYHDQLAWVFAGLLALHIAGALFHHLIVKDNTLRRMLRRAPSASIH